MPAIAIMKLFIIFSLQTPAKFISLTVGLEASSLWLIASACACWRSAWRSAARTYLSSSRILRLPGRRSNVSTFSAVRWSLSSS